MPSRSGRAARAAHGAGQALREGTQQRIAHGVTMRVIDSLEAVQIEQQQRAHGIGHACLVQRGEQGSAQSVWMHPQTGTAFGLADMRSPDSKAAKGGS